MSRLNVTNGDAVAGLLREGGVAGEMLPWNDLLHEGAVPAGLSPSGLPVGAQLATRIGGEALLLQLAYQLEEAAPWIDTLPELHA